MSAPTPTSTSQQNESPPVSRPDDIRPHGTRRALIALTGNWVFLALIGVIVVFALWGGHTFLSVSNFRDILWNSTTIILLAVGTAYLIIGGQLDLSIGAVLVFSSVIGAKIIVKLSGTPGAGGAYSHPILGILTGGLACILIGAAWGLLNGVLVTRLKIPSFVVTLGTMGMALGLAQVIGGGTDVVGLPPSSIQKILGTQDFLGIKVVVWIALGIALVAGAILATTRFGRYTYAIGSNAEASRRGGIRVDRHVIILFVITGSLAGLAGFLEFTRFTTTAINGHSSDNLLAIAAVIIGGTSLFGGRGTIFGAVVGVLIPVVLSNGFQIVGVQPFWQTVLIGAFLIIAVTFDQIKRKQVMRA